MTDRIYFSTINGDYVDNYDIARAAHIVGGGSFDPLDFDMIRLIASDYCKGVLEEIKKPSVEHLIKHGHKIRAVTVFYDEHPELGLEGAREAVEHIAKQLKVKR